MAFQSIFQVIGILLTILSGFMLPPIIIDLADANRDWQAFAAAGAVTLGAGIMLILATQGARPDFRLRSAFLLTAASWMILCLFAALPFWFAELGLSFTDAVFEATSGLTTTGATVITGLDHAPRGILLWRALLHGLGGIGIVVMAVLILPFLRVGGQQLFRSESSDRSDKPFPRLGQIVSGISVVYITLITGCFILLMVFGMSWFDALAHALSAVSTGGFSTRDASIGFYQNAGIEWVTTFFMLAAALPFVWYIRVARAGSVNVINDSQVWSFITTAFGFSAVLAAWLIMTQPEREMGDAIRAATFNVVSMITTTGFMSEDFSLWGGLASVLFTFMLFIGGCSGSTSGGIKIFRWQILFLSLVQQLHRMVQPNRVMPLFYSGRKVGADELQAVINFFFIYVLTFALLSAGLAATGLDWESSLTAAAASISNAGPGLGPIVGPAANYIPVSDVGIWILSFGMLLGRLELFTLLILFVPNFWKD